MGVGAYTEMGSLTGRIWYHMDNRTDYAATCTPVRVARDGVGREGACCIVVGVKTSFM